MVSNLGFLQLAPLGLAFGRPPADKAQGSLTQTQGGGEVRASRWWSKCDQLTLVDGC